MGGRGHGGGSFKCSDAVANVVPSMATSASISSAVETKSGERGCGSIATGPVVDANTEYVSSHFRDLATMTAVTSFCFIFSHTWCASGSEPSKYHHTSTCVSFSPTTIIIYDYNYCEAEPET